MYDPDISRQYDPREGDVPKPQVELQRQSWLVAAAARKMRSMHQARHAAAWRGMAWHGTAQGVQVVIDRPPWQADVFEPVLYS